MRKPSYWHTHFGGRWKYVVSIRNLFPRRIREAVGLAEWIKLSVVIREHCNLFLGDVLCVPLGGEYTHVTSTCHDKHLSLFLLRWDEVLDSGDPWREPLGRVRHGDRSRTFNQMLLQPWVSLFHSDPHHETADFEYWHFRAEHLPSFFILFITCFDQ